MSLQDAAAIAGAGRLAATFGPLGAVYLRSRKLPKRRGQHPDHFDALAYRLG
jgi:hypothetical protein